ncbi:MAG TPA: ABC transporter ATP-binding protein, partial [Acidimicrobiales bacterium]|nr:ABC transporter ATP-binding protein [Acidimicrobiales bacterium]
MKELAVRGVVKSFGDLRVLDRVELTVPTGSFTGILGASGSGKTTLLRIIAGFERLDSGEVRLGSEIVDDGQRTFVPTERRRVGYVPQEGALFPHLSVGRNVAFGLRRGPDRRARVRELLEMVGLEGLGRRYPHQLSGGQQQRVALARALATGPEFVLLDEPFSSLDASLRASVRAEVHDVLRRAGTTSILVTHDQDEALSMADQVAVLRDGVIAQLDTPAGIYRHPRDADLAQFLGESNVIHAPVGSGAGGNGAMAAETPLGRLPVEGWPASAAAGPAEVLIRPEQLVIAGAEAGTVIATIESYQYFGHDAVVRVRPELGGLPELVVRVTGGTPLEAGARVGLTVLGPVVAWPAGADPV